MDLKLKAWDKRKKEMVTNFVLAPTSPTWSGFPIETPQQIEDLIMAIHHEWTPGQNISPDLWAKVFEFISCDYTYTDWANMYGGENYEILLYSGMSDDKNEEIFEQDILKTNIGNCQVIFREAMFICEWPFYGATDLAPFNVPLFSYHTGGITKIGNTFENSDLLE